MYLGCWRAYVVTDVQYDGMALHCPLRLQHYDVVSVSIVLQPQSLYLSRMKNQHGHGVFWVLTGRKNGCM